MSGLVQDAYRFILYHRAAIENSPLQAYVSALVFSPPRSTIQQLFRHERPKNIAMAPAMGDDWDAHTGACLQTLESHDGWVHSVVFSHDSSRVASGSDDKTIKIWDAQTGACLQTLEGHDGAVYSVVFSHDSSRVASGSGDSTIKIWDAHTGACLQTLEGHDETVYSVVFSHDSSRVASGSGDSTIKIWDAHTGACLQTHGMKYPVSNLSFDATGSSLHTDIGIVALRDSLTPAPTTSKELLPSESQSLPATQQSQPPEHLGYRISSDRSWITRCSQNWLWLPPMYRPRCSAVGQSGLVLVLGCQSGRVLIFGFIAEDYN
jgi:WD40 repeat protein